jgi:hypothetical protein
MPYLPTNPQDTINIDGHLTTVKFETQTFANRPYATYICASVMTAEGMWAVGGWLSGRENQLPPKRVDSVRTYLRGLLERDRVTLRLGRNSVAHEVDLSAF